MSILLMSAAFKTPIKATPKLVLLGLCDAANDLGECYPSISNLSEKCSAGERTVQDALAYLEREGYIAREFRNGRSTVYTIRQPSEWPLTPAVAAPPQIPHPRRSRTPPPQIPHPTPADPAPGGAVAAPITITQPSKNRQGNQKTEPPPTVPAFELVAAGFTFEQAEDFIAHKASKKAPLTARAWADHKREAASAGWSAVDAAEKVMAKGWKGFEASYVASARPQAGKQSALESRNAQAVARYMEGRG